MNNDSDIYRKNTVGPGARQRGAALVAMTAVLLAVASIGVLTMSRVGQVEQRVAGNDVRLKEVYAAAIGGLEYGATWLEENFSSITWTDADSDGESEEGDTASPPTMANLALSADSYSRTITYTLRSSANPVDEAMPRIVEISSTATAVNDSHVTKTVSSTFMLSSTSLFSPSSANGLGFAGPPVIVEDCFGSITGNPDAYPLNGTSVGTTQGTADDICLPPGHLDMNGGGRVALSPSQSLWNTIFGPDKTEADLLAMQEEMPDRMFFVDDNYPYHGSQPSLGTNWHADLGSATEPVILYFASGYCNKINGNTVIWGIVFYADATCTSNGFGGGDIHGTLAKAGDLVKLNSNTELFGTDLDYGGQSGGTGTEIDIGFSVPQFTEIPGSWRDF